MKNDQFKFIYEGNNYPFVRPSEWNSKLPEAKNRDSTIAADDADDADDSHSFDGGVDGAVDGDAGTRKLHRQDLLDVPNSEGISRDQYLGNIFSHQYNWPYNPYDVYVPLYKWDADAKVDASNGFGMW